MSEKNVEEKKVDGEIVSGLADLPEHPDAGIKPSDVAVVSEPNLPAQKESAAIIQLKAFISDETEKRKLLIDYIRNQLVDGVDFGSIHVYKDCDEFKRTGTCQNKRHWSKPTLFKPGSEKICSLMKLTPTFSPDLMMIDLLKAQQTVFISIPLICKLINIVGKKEVVVAEGRGIASVKVDSYNIDFDLNKQMKIAEKRAQTDAVLRLGFSFYFTQDLEDLPKDRPQQQNLPPPYTDNSKTPAHNAPAGKNGGAQAQGNTNTSPASNASRNANQSQQNSNQAAKLKFDVNQPLKFGKHRGKLVSDPGIHVGWIMFMLDRVDDATAKALTALAHDKSEGHIMRYCASRNVTADVLGAEIEKRFKKRTLKELTLQEKIQFCEIIDKEG